MAKMNWGRPARDYTYYQKGSEYYRANEPDKIMPTKKKRKKKRTIEGHRKPTMVRDVFDANPEFTEKQIWWAYYQLKTHKITKTKEMYPNSHKLLQATWEAMKRERL